jgi:hypothetical protein
LGTAATTTLTALPWNAMVSYADVATINNGIKDDDIVTRPRARSAFTRGGQLWIPNRGYLILQPGDYIAFDTQTGWPILLSNLAAAGASWVHT